MARLFPVEEVKDEVLEPRSLCPGSVLPAKRGGRAYDEAHELGNAAIEAAGEGGKADAEAAHALGALWVLGDTLDVPRTLLFAPYDAERVLRAVDLGADGARDETQGRKASRPLPGDLERIEGDVASDAVGEELLRQRAHACGVGSDWTRSDMDTIALVARRALCKLAMRG
jgi:hypothetical protein